MLGARARAAEYNAFKAASARQASREAEEQKLPPKPAPVSLSAFTKNAQPSRNKGTKAWVPLVFEDTPEDENDSSGDNDGTILTPTRPSGSTNCTIPASPLSETRLGSRNLEPIRVNIPTLSVPTAPKAMTALPERPPVIVNPTPRRILPHSIFKQSRRDAPSSAQSSPSNVAGPCVFPNPEMMWTFNLQGISMPGLQQIPVFNPNEQFGHFMVPSDISPTKQENKFAFLCQQFADPSPGIASSHQPFSGNTQLNDNSMLQHITGSHYASDPLAWDSYQHINPFTQNPIHRPALGYVHSDFLLPADGEVAGHLSQSGVSLARSLTFPSPGTGNLDERRTVDNTTLLAAQDPGLNIATTPDNEPYDRNSKMQSFVAAQQALAKTGKTVLHNPDLHRVKASGTATLTPGERPNMISELDTCVESNAEILKIVPHAIANPPPGFETPAINRPNTKEQKGPCDFPFGGDTLWKEFGVGMEDWVELEPVTQDQRKRMNRMVRLWSMMDGAGVPKKFVQNNRLERLRHWVLVETQNNQAARKATDQIAKDQLYNRQSNMADGIGGASSRTADAKTQSASIYAMEMVLANLAADSAEYKPAPEYAIERGRLLTGGSSIVSFFEEDTGGFYNAPSRIARDPRFRPPSKEGVKSKVEDEWKHRHDMYGRRRI